MNTLSAPIDLAAVEEAILGGTTSRRGEAVIARGEGCWLWDTTGRRYLDLTAAQGVAMLGHCHPALTRAIAEQAQTLIACPNFLYNDVRARFAAKLVEVLPGHLHHVFLANSGAEAIDGALKFARLATGRTGIIAFRSCFHGRTVGAVSMTWEKKYREPFLPLLDVTHLPYNNLEKLDAALDDRIGVVFVEVVQGEGGVNLGEAGFLQGVQRLCRERGALLVIDEIQTGFGRTGAWFGHQHFGLEPDMICLAKGLGSGFPDGRDRLYGTGERGALCRRPRQHLWRQPAGLRSRDRRHPGLPGRTPGGARGRHGRPAVGPPAHRAGRRGVGARDSRHRADGRRRAAPEGRSLSESAHGRPWCAGPAGGEQRAAPAAPADHRRAGHRDRRAAPLPPFCAKHNRRAMDSQTAVALLQGLVAIPSLSHSELAAAEWLVAQMAALGYDRAFVDEAGNAVGEMGPADAAQTVVLLGHIDTVPGAIPVRIEQTAGGPALYGRGSVDAKGPLATFTAAVARLGSAWAREHDVRLIVVGAVEEEAASSKGARHIRDRFDGVHQPLPAACIIGEPSGWTRVTLGYKGRLLVELEASQPMAHTAGPDAGVATVAVDFWNWLSDYAARFNAGIDKAFDQFSPSLRRLHTFTDEQMHDHVIAQAGIRLPLAFDADGFVAALCDWAATRAGAASPLATTSPLAPRPSPLPGPSPLRGPLTAITLQFSAHEVAWRSDRNNGLVRSFLAAIRAVGPAQKPGFVVKTGTSDMNTVGPAWNCPILAYGPGDSSLDHTPHEHVHLEEYWNAVLVLEQALRYLVE